MNRNTDIIRHFLATLAYRFQMTVRDAPSGFGDFAPGSGVRTPGEIVRHMTHVLKYAHRCFEESANVKTPAPLVFAEEILRFHGMLTVLDRDLINTTTVDNDLLNNILQGPLSDAMTHIGQIAMLRRMAGVSVRGQNFMAADIKTGHLGPDQSDPLKPFEG